MSNIYSIWLNQLKLSEYVKKQLLIRAFSCQEIYEAPSDVYKAWGFTPLAIQQIQAGKKNLQLAQAIDQRCWQEEIAVIDYYHQDYPWLLKEIPDPPVLLYVKGNQKLLRKAMVAMVGSRGCSEYGYQMAISLAKQMADWDLCVVSGMAMGIDKAAHFGALQTGATIGILGTGVNICYPSCNEQIYRQLLNKGAVISEYPPDTLARPYHFPKRNRIISGMSYGTVVIEAAVRSGSLITAQLAFDYNREVYALPGNVTSKLSQGTNALIKRGARCIVSAEDIIAELPQGLCFKKDRINKNINKFNQELAEEERIVYANVSQEPIMFEKILESTQLSYERINTSLLQLEVKGLIQRLPGERYVRI